MANYIRKIEYNNHPILGDLILDFENDTKPYNTIIFAGENGCGKTSILSTLSGFLNLGSITPFNKIIYSIDDKIFTIIPENQGHQFGFHKRKEEKDNKIYPVHRNGSFESQVKEILGDPEDIRHYGCVYSQSRAGFSTKEIETIKTSELDKDRYEKDAIDDFTSLKQLLIDIIQQDNNEWATICNDGVSHNKKSEFDDNSRISRFKKAFENFFDKRILLKNSEISEKGKHQIYFIKDGKNISIDNLSTGEKQIVFRGAILLKNIKNLEGGVIFIDEPELSMHPKWQKKILKFYRDLFTKDGKQIAQIFFATHSEYILEDALKDRENVLIIGLKNNNGKIDATKFLSPLILPRTSQSEIKYKIFGIPNIDYFNSLYDYFQIIHNLEKVGDADKAIRKHPEFDEKRDYKESGYGTVRYFTMPTYMRNLIHHPGGRQYNDEDLKQAIELMEKICVSQNKENIGKTS